VSAPGFWPDETSGVLRPAIYAYLRGFELRPEQVAAIRAYFRQWVNRGDFRGPEIDGLRDAVDSLHSRAQIETWLRKALDAGIDPL